MGNPHEDDYFYRGYRDHGQGDPREREFVTDPTKLPIKADPQAKAFVDEFFSRLREEMAKTPILAKRPAFVEPPFWSNPLLKVADIDVPATGAWTTILTRTIEDRHRAVVGLFGIDTENPAAYVAHLLRFRFQVNGRTLPLFDDQTPVPPVAVALAFGETTIIPGTVASPLNLLAAGVAFQVRGAGQRILTFQCANDSGAAVEVRALMGYWQYRLQKSAEFEEADNQV